MPKRFSMNTITRSLICFTAIILIAGGFCSPQALAQSVKDGEDAPAKMVQKKKGAPVPFPFTKVEDEEEYDLMINLRDERVKSQLKPVMQKYNLAYTPASFEDLITEMLEQDAALSSVAIFSAREDKLLIGSGNVLYRQNMIRLLRPALQNGTSLDRFLKSREQEEE